MEVRKQKEDVQLEDLLEVFGVTDVYGYEDKNCYACYTCNNSCLAGCYGCSEA